MSSELGAGATVVWRMLWRMLRLQVDLVRRLPAILITSTGLQARRRGEWLTGTGLTEAQTVGKKNMADGNPNTNLA